MNRDIEVCINKITVENTNPNFCQKEHRYETAQGSCTSYEYNWYDLLISFNVKKLWKKYNNYKYQNGILQEYITEIHTKTDRKTLILQIFPDHKFIKKIATSLLKADVSIRREYPE
jgi:hypothetical protein